MLRLFRLSDRLFVTRVDQSKTFQVRITQFSPYSSVIHSSLQFFRDKFYPEILSGSPRVGASNKDGVWKTSHFLALYVSLENGTRYDESYY